MARCTFSPKKHKPLIFVNVYFYSSLKQQAVTSKSHYSSIPIQYKMLSYRLNNRLGLHACFTLYYARLMTNLLLYSKISLDYHTTYHLRYRHHRHHHRHYHKYAPDWIIAVSTSCIPENLLVDNKTQLMYRPPGSLALFITMMFSLRRYGAPQNASYTSDDKALVVVLWRHGASSWKLVWCGDQHSMR